MAIAKKNVENFATSSFLAGESWSEIGSAQND